VLTKSAITVTFSEAMDPATINATNITLKVTLSGNPRAGTVTYDATTHVATFTPTVQLLRTRLHITIVPG
jgi:hypothetical protein